MAKITPIDDEPIYNLALTFDELNTLYTILHFVAGDFDTTDRNHSDSVLTSIIHYKLNAKLQLNYDPDKIKGYIEFL